MKKLDKKMEKGITNVLIIAALVFFTMAFVTDRQSSIQDITGFFVLDDTGSLDYIDSCYDGIMNPRETGIDCGGPCKPCCMPDVNIFGPVNAKSTGIGNLYDYDFEAIPGKYLIYIGSNYGATAWIDLNGEYVITPDYIINKLITYEVNIEESNKMIIRMNSDTGSSLVIWISNLCDCDTALVCPETFECDGWCVPKENCDDGIKNQDEDGIDCGGQCKPCIAMPIVVQTPWISNIAEFIKDIWIMVVYALMIVILLAGAVYTASNYRQMSMYKEYQSYRKRRKQELKQRMLERDRQLRIIQAENRRKAIEKAKQEYLLILDGFIHNAIGSGKTKTQIKKGLLEQGWPKKFVNSYCNKFFKIYSEIIRSKREEVREIKRMKLLERELDHISGEIKESPDYIEKELPEKWSKPGKGVEIKKKKLEYEFEKVSKEELAKLAEQVDRIDQEIERSPEYIKNELITKWSKPGKGVELDEKKLKFKKQEASKKDIEVLEKELLLIGEKMKSSKEYIEGELPNKWDKPGKGVELDEKKIKFKEKYFSAEDYEKLLKRLKYQKAKLGDVSIEKNKDYVDEESKFRYEPVKKLKFKKQETSKNELAKLAEQMNELDKKMEQGADYFTNELPKKWIKKEAGKPIELVERKVKFKKQEISEEEISKLQKHLGKIDEELEKLKRGYAK